MNKILYVIVATLTLQAQGVQWRSWDAALVEAQHNGKIIMIDAVRDHCHYCDDMEAAVFDDDAMAVYIEADFIPVKVNISHETMPLGLKVPMTPSFYFITAQQEFLKMVPGSWNQEDFKSFLEGVRP